MPAPPQGGLIDPNAPGATPPRPRHPEGWNVTPGMSGDPSHPGGMTTEIFPEGYTGPTDPNSKDSMPWNPDKQEGHWEWDPQQNRPVWVSTHGARDRFNWGAEPPGGYSKDLVTTRDRLWGGANEAGGRAGPTTDWSSYDANMGNAAQSRDAQAGLADYYKGILSGKAPSVAAIQQQQGLAASAAGASSLAASSPGGYNPLLARQAMGAQSAAGLAAVTEGAKLRAGEQAGAAGAYSDLISNQRQQDLAAAGVDAQRASVLLQTEAGQRALNDQDRKSTRLNSSHRL